MRSAPSPSAATACGTHPTQSKVPGLRTSLLQWSCSSTVTTEQPGLQAHIRRMAPSQMERNALGKSSSWIVHFTAPFLFPTATKPLESFTVPYGVTSCNGLLAAEFSIEHES